MLEHEKELYKSIKAPDHLRERVEKMAQETPVKKDWTFYAKKPQIWGSAVAVCVLVLALSIGFGPGLLSTQVSVLLSHQQVGTQGVCLDADVETEIAPMTARSFAEIILPIQAVEDETIVTITHGVLQQMRDGTLCEFLTLELSAGQSADWVVVPQETTEELEMQITAAGKTGIYQLYEEDGHWYIKQRK